MRECPHSVWCKCQRGEKMMAFKRLFSKPDVDPDSVMASYEELEAFVQEDVCCEIKTHAEMCSWAHYSPGVAKGGLFTPFTCSCCGYSPTESQWQADLTAWHAMTDAEQATAHAAHFDVGDELNSQHQHYHQVACLHPALPSSLV